MTLMVAPTTGLIADRYCNSKIKKTKLFRVLKHTGQLFYLYIYKRKIACNGFRALKIDVL